MDDVVKRIPFYRDKRADTLTREELLEAYTHACDMLESMCGQQREDAEMQRLFDEAEERIKRRTYLTRLCNI